jgi:hypothetical protein
MTDSAFPGSNVVPLVRLVNGKAHLKNWYIEIQASCPDLIKRFKRRCYLMEL